MPSSVGDFRAVQATFSAYIRDPRSAPLPRDVPLARINAYRDLFFNNIESFIATGFPVLKSILSDAKWRELIQDFIALHRCQTPLFVGIAEEFVHWIESLPHARFEEKPFLFELVRHEWVELALSTQEGSCPPLESDFEEGLDAAKLQLSPLVVLKDYVYPVHRIGPDHAPILPPDTKTFLLAYRDREDLVQFVELNAVSFALLEALLGPEVEPLGSILSGIAEDIGHPDPSQVLAFGLSLMASLHRKGVLGRKSF